MAVRHALAAGCVLAMLAGVARDAAAEPVVKYENREWNMVGFAGGMVYAGSSSQGGGGLFLAHGRKLGTLHWSAEYAALYVVQTGDQESHGLFHRLGVTAKLPVTSFLVLDESMEIGFWLEAGAGIHRTVGPEAQWRRDMVFGWAAEYRSYRNRYQRDNGGVGIWLGARILVSETGRYDAPVALGMSSRPHRPFDVGLLAIFGVRWGR